uniref:glutamine synthetase n=1 Tax=Heliothis virescens TaxID=7102 RepID=A0A2A4J2C5_HELVI
MVKNVGRVHGTPPKGPTLVENPLGKYFSLPLPDDKVLATYVWIDGTGENLRSKERTLDFMPKVAEDLPVLTYDGSGTRQARKKNADMYLFPRAIYRNPIHRGRSILVMCDTFDKNLQPTATNNRVRCAEAYLKCAEEEPWFGIEQELYLMNSYDLRPLGWPYKGFPDKTTQYHYGIGADKAFGRELMEAHYKCCLYAGIAYGGLNVEMGPSQWEYQVGPSVGVSAGDDVWMARYILQILAEQYGVAVSIKPKPIPHWQGSGTHVNFSTKLMREENGIIEIEKAIGKLAAAHKDHLKLYDPYGGRDNARRLIGSHQAAHMHEFSAGVSERSTCIRIHRSVAVDKKGFFEDRRPASNCDPYRVIDSLLRTCVLNE